jgi:hypothetical protein
MWRALIIAAGCLGAACVSSPDPPVSFVQGLRVLAIQAEPPEIPVGATAQLTILAVDTTGRAVDVAWARCGLAPLSGQAVNVGCVDQVTAPHLTPLGNGMTIAAEMPAVTPGELGQPDATNGVYLPVVARTSAGEDEVTAVYRLRLADGASPPPNTNPAITSIDVLDADGAATPLDAATPLVVHAGDELTLTNTFAPDSAQTYTAFGGMMLTETLTVAWFCTAGELSVDRTSAKQPQTVLSLRENLPAPGKIIDLFTVAHDERGGVGYTHRSLVLQ